MELPLEKASLFNKKPRKIKFKLSLLDEIAPLGFPSNSLILFSGEGGIAKSAILQCLSYRFLRARYACIYLCVDEHPISVCQSMLLHGLKVEKFVEEGRLQLLDLFSYRLNISNSDAPKIAGLVLINYPVNWQSLFKILSSNLDSLLENYGRAIIIIDSLTELLSRLDVNSVLDLLKVVRVEICKKRSTPVFASLHFGLRNYEDFEQILDYNVDGIFDLRYDPLAMQNGVLIKQMRARKLRGAVYDTRWHSFEILKGNLVSSSVENILRKVEA